MKSLVSKILVSVIIMTATGMVYAAKPLKVYVLVGQSNMQGTANLSTAKHMAADPKAKALHDKLIDADGKARILEDVRIAAFSSKDAEKSGPLTFGYGNALTDPNVCGPELGFGVTMHESVDEPILIIKTSWGGKSLCIDFRPPSAGPYPLSEHQQETYDQERKDSIVEATGHYYRLMSKHVKAVLADPGKYHPAYDKKAGYEVAGFVWFQGWNDMVNGHTYPNRYQPGGYDTYSKDLAHFIKDVRKEFDAPKMPFVIGVLGVGGPTKLYTSKRYQGVHQYYRDAMAAPAALPEFKDNVRAVLTEEFWPHDVAAAETKVRELGNRAKEALAEEQKKNPELKGRAASQWQRDRTNELMEKEMSDEERLALSGKSNQGFHYLGSMKFYSQAGEAFAKAVASVGTDE